VAKMLLINPRRRRARKANPSRKRHARKANPIAKRVHRARRHRRHNPVSLRRVHRRRRNPISAGGLLSGIGPMVKTAFLGAAGAVAVDYAYGMVKGSLPASMQVVPGSVGTGDAVKALLTVVLGRGLRGVTRGASLRMAEGALTVQANGLLRSMLPASITSQLGYAVPGFLTTGNNRIGPNQFSTTMNAYLPAGGTSPLLAGRMGAYLPGGGPSPLLAAGSGNRVNARMRESIRR